MRTEGQIRRQLRQVLYRHLQRELRANFKHRPHTCRHSVILTLTNGEQVRTCGHAPPVCEGGIPNASFLCDAGAPGGVALAKKCPWWEARQTKDEVRAEFAALIESGDRGCIAAKYPDIAALMWILDARETDLSDLLSDEDET